MQETLVTSSGVIYERSKPRVGVVSVSSLGDIWDEIVNGIDLGYEFAYQEALAESSGDEDETERRLQYFESSGPYLFGDWQKGNDGYEPNTAGPNGFAACYNPDSGIVTVEWSQETRWVHHTSPCYVMADGRGPCGDLDTPGDAVLAYTLPESYFSKGD
jgi:hypothetical protein